VGWAYFSHGGSRVVKEMGWFGNFEVGGEEEKKCFAEEREGEWVKGVAIF
jgi:hypothetical protein